MAEIDVDLSEAEWQELKLRVYDNGLWQYAQPVIPGQGFSLNILDVWREYSGAGFKVAIYDDGVQGSHPDLVANYDASLEVNSGSNAAPEQNDNHGTAVAGIIGADRNGPVIGVAFGARIVGVDLNDVSNVPGHHDAPNVVGFRQNFDIVNQSFTFGAFDGWDAPTGAPQLYANMQTAVSQGRSGLGTIIVQAAGNGRNIGPNNPFPSNTNQSALTNNEGSIVVANVQQSGLIALDSTPGSNILVSALGNGTNTTDRTGADGYSGSDYTVFGGTSAAAPQVSGIVALMLEANAGLGYRDVQEILAYSARHVGSEIGAPILNGSEQYFWRYNGAKDWNGGGLHFSEDYGFGLVDAHAAVRLAETWLEQSTAANRVTTRDTRSVAQTQIPENGGVFSLNFNETDAIEIETVSVTMRIGAGQADDLVVTLQAPSGTITTLLDGSEASAASGDRIGTWAFNGAGVGTWTMTSTGLLTLTSNAFRGESSQGTWILRISDNEANPENGGTADNAFFVSADLVTSGRSAAAAKNDTYVYTDEFHQLFLDLANVDGRRFNLRDTDGGIDTINAAASTTDNFVTLANSISQLAGGFVTIQQGTIENYIGGDGIDHVTGNSVGNDIYGGRGNDKLYGMGGRDELFGGRGDDILDGGADADNMTGGDGNDTYYVNSVRDKVIETAGSVDPENNDLRRGGIDTVLASSTAYALSAFVENLTYTGTASFSGTGNSLDNTIIGGANADALDGGAGNDKLIGGLGNDTYTIDSLDDEIVENSGEGIDKVIVQRISGYVLGANLENMHVDHGASGLDQIGTWVASGNDENNIITTTDGNVLGLGNVTRYEIYGGGGNDTITGANQGKLGDNLDGGEGDDVLRGLSGDDLLRGGLGADTLDGGTNFKGGDTADYSLATSGIIVDMTKAVEGLGGEALGDNFVSIENVTGSEHADTITGNGSANRLKGLGGDDTLLGGGGNDILEGGNGNDRLEGGTGADKLFGGDGDDLLVVDNSDTVIDGGAGWDMVFAAGSQTAGLKFNLAGTNVEYVSGNSGSDSFDATTNTEANYQIEFVGNVGADTLRGGSGIEWFWGGQGTDTMVFSGNRADYTITSDTDLGPWAGWTYVENISSGVGDWLLSVETLQFADQIISSPDSYVQFNGTVGIDVRTGTDARDEMYGGAGNDILSGGGGTDILNGGAGVDTLSGGEGNDALFIDNSDIVSGGGGYDTVYADDSQGPLGLNFTVGSTGVEAVWGGRGADVIDASTAPAFAPGIGVSLYGNAGDDVLIGSAFIDLIEGGLGDDTITGGLGDDAFTFNFNGRGGGRDTITDFEDGFDRLSIWDPDAGTSVGYADVTVTDSTEGAVVTYANGEIVLAGILASQINQDDFFV